MASRALGWQSLTSARMSACLQSFQRRSHGLHEPGRRDRKGLGPCWTIPPGVVEGTLGRFFAGPVTRNGLVIGYGGAPLAKIARGGQIVHEILQSPGRWRARMTDRRLISTLPPRRGRITSPALGRGAGVRRIATSARRRSCPGRRGCRAGANRGARARVQTSPRRSCPSRSPGHNPAWRRSRSLRRRSCCPR
jgi:hypothetical protein